MTFMANSETGAWHYKCSIKGCNERTENVSLGHQTPDAIRAWKPGMDVPGDLHFCPQHMHDFDAFMAGEDK